MLSHVFDEMNSSAASGSYNTCETLTVRKHKWKNKRTQCSHFQICSVEKLIWEYYNSYEGEKGKMPDLWSSREMFTLDSESRRDVLTSHSSALGCCSPEAVCGRTSGADVKRVNLASSSASAAFPSSEMLLRKERAACLCLRSISTGKKTWQKVLLPAAVNTENALLNWSSLQESHAGFLTTQK